MKNEGISVSVFLAAVVTLSLVAWYFASDQSLGAYVVIFGIVAGIVFLAVVLILNLRVVAVLLAVAGVVYLLWTYLPMQKEPASDPAAIQTSAPQVSHSNSAGSVDEFRKQEHSQALADTMQNAREMEDIATAIESVESALTAYPDATNYWQAESFLTHLKVAQKRAGNSEAEFQNGLTCFQSKSREERANGSEHFRKAAEMGHSEAMYYLGYCYRNGSCGAKMQDDLALKWYRQSAEAGFAKAQVMMGRICANGTLHVPISKTRALEWFKLAAKQGDSEAVQLVGQYEQAAEQEAYEKSQEDKGLVKSGAGWISQQEAIRQQMDDIERRGATKSPPDRDAAEAYLKIVSEQLIKQMGGIIQAEYLGFGMDYLDPKPPQSGQFGSTTVMVIGEGEGYMDATAWVRYRWTFQTKLGLVRTTDGYLRFNHFAKRGEWEHNSYGDKIDGLPTL